MSNQIDLSKAYAGQIVVLRNGTKHTLKEDVYVDSNGWCVIDDYGYMKDGTFSSVDRGGDIVAIEDPIQIQAARIEGEVKGLEFALGCEPYEREQICNRIDELNAQLKALQDGNN